MSVFFICVIIAGAALTQWLFSDRASGMHDDEHRRWRWNAAERAHLATRYRYQKAEVRRSRAQEELGAKDAAFDQGFFETRDQEAFAVAMLRRHYVETEDAREKAIGDVAVKAQH